jgi:hypothetical protein
LLAERSRRSVLVWRIETGLHGKRGSRRHGRRSRPRKRSRDSRIPRAPSAEFRNESNCANPGDG